MIHLPECVQSTEFTAFPALRHVCICTMLKNCEQRVRDEEFLRCARKVVAERRKILDQAEDIIKDRIQDLQSCNKDDDCDTIATGALLALSDIQYWRWAQK